LVDFFLNSLYTNFSIQRFQVFGGCNSIFGAHNCLKYNILKNAREVLCDTIMTFLLDLGIWFNIVSHKVVSFN
jgi:hypothetical protein